MFFAHGKISPRIHDTKAHSCVLATFFPACEFLQLTERKLRREDRARPRNQGFDGGLPRQSKTIARRSFLPHHPRHFNFLLSSSHPSPPFAERSDDEILGSLLVLTRYFNSVFVLTRDCDSAEERAFR